VRCKEAWFRIQSSQPQALTDLMKAVENYTSVLAHNMPQTFTQPFDAVHDNIGTSQTVYCIFVVVIIIIITRRHAALWRDDLHPPVRPSAAVSHASWRDIAILACRPPSAHSTPARSRSALVVRPRPPPAPFPRLSDRPHKPCPWSDSQSDYCI